jgi:hypothetical protein
MAAEEVIHFSLRAQLSQLPNSPPPSPPEPIAEPPPLAFISCDHISNRRAIRVSRRHSERTSRVANE